MTQLVVLAGGMGTRLRDSIPIGTPKPMAEVGGRPFLEHVFDQAAQVGVDQILLLLGRASSTIASHFGPQYDRIPVEYSVESEPLGTGGALVHASSQLEEEFVLLNGDTYVEVSFSELMHRTARAPLALSLTAVSDTGRFGRVEVDAETVVRLQEKGQPGPGLINAGVYGCRKSILALLPEAGPSSFETDLLEAHLPALRPGFVRTGPVFFDIGVPEDYEAADRYFRAIRPVVTNPTVDGSGVVDQSAPSGTEGVRHDKDLDL